MKQHSVGTEKQHPQNTAYLTRSISKTSSQDLFSCKKSPKFPYNACFPESEDIYKYYFSSLYIVCKILHNLF